jgi:Uma2 family endonuclease
MVQMTDTPVPLGEHVPTADRRVVIRGLDWSGFQTVLALRGDRSPPRMTYLDGALEIMVPSRTHEDIKSMIGILLEVYCLDSGILFKPYGSWLLDDESEEAGVEPDECYVFAEDPATKDRPDLAIEVIWTSGGLDKLEVYKRLGIDEVWIWKRDAIAIYGLTAAGYELRAQSAWLPELDLLLLLTACRQKTVNAAVAELRAGVTRK